MVIGSWWTLLLGFFILSKPVQKIIVLMYPQLHKARQELWVEILAIICIQIGQDILLFYPVNNKSIIVIWYKSIVLFVQNIFHVIVLFFKSIHGYIMPVVLKSLKILVDSLSLFRSAFFFVCLSTRAYFYYLRLSSKAPSWRR